MLDVRWSKVPFFNPCLVSDPLWIFGPNFFPPSDFRPHSLIQTLAKTKVNRNVSEKAQDQKFANYDISEITTELSNIETTTTTGLYSSSYKQLDGGGCALGPSSRPSTNLAAGRAETSWASGSRTENLAIFSVIRVHQFCYQYCDEYYIQMGCLLAPSPCWNCNIYSQNLPWQLRKPSPQIVYSSQYQGQNWKPLFIIIQYWPAAVHLIM